MPTSAATAPARAAALPTPAAAVPTLAAPAPGATIAFVDVPGHERFVANLLAGIGAIDLALLVVAADDGPMPQTREHLRILGLLGVPRCIVVLTKVDRVDAARRQAAAAEVAALLASSRYRGAPLFPVVATRGDGVPALIAALADAAAHCPARPDRGHFRLAVDRSFTVAGAGRIVTGAVLSGRVRVGDRLVVAPRGTPVRVRGLQLGHRSADEAGSGVRVALNLVGTALKDAEPVRGDWVVAEPAHAPTDRLDVRLTVPRDGLSALAHLGVLQLHLGGAALAVRLRLPGGQAIAPGDHGWARLRLARPVSALFGDRFVLRDPAAGRVVAGGVVIDPFGPSRGQATAARLAQLEALATPDAALALRRLLAAAAADGVPRDPYVRGRNLTEAEATAALTAAGAVSVPTRAGHWLLAAPHWQAWCDRTHAALARWHAEAPASVGPTFDELAAGWMKAPEAGPSHEPAARAASHPAIGTRKRLASHGTTPPTPAPRTRGAGAARPLLDAALDALAAGGGVARDGMRWRLAAHRPSLPAADAVLLARVEAVLAPAGLRPPIVGDLAATLALPLPALLDFLHGAAALGVLVRVAPNRFFLPRTVAELAACARQLAARSADAGFDAAAFRDRTGIGRNLTVQVLEWLDRANVTRFDGQRRRAA